MVPVLQSPIYAPETIAEKLRSQPDGDFTSAYVELVRAELSGKNCVILASSDVNPIAEVVLAFAYEGRSRTGGSRQPECFVGGKRQNDDATVIALKGETASTDDKSQPGPMSLGRRFARTIPAGPKRGFLIDGREQLLDYSSQDQSEKPFSILAHLVVVRNPFTPDDNVIVVLNGVSGPATFGLAEALTGGARGKRAEESEALLKKINQVWSEELEPGRSREFNGVEAILKVEVAPPDLTGSDGATSLSGQKAGLASGIRRQFFDTRSVQGWGLCDLPNMKFGNPRPFPFG